VLNQRNEDIHKPLPASKKMMRIRDKVINYLKKWKTELNEDIDSGRLFLFGSLINYTILIIILV